MTHFVFFIEQRNLHTINKIVDKEDKTKMFFGMSVEYLTALFLILTGNFLIEVSCNRCEKVSGISKAIRSNRTQVWKLEMSVEHFENISPKSKVISNSTMRISFS